MQRTIRKLYSTDRKGPPYESNELNSPLADRYSAGVLDMGDRPMRARVVPQLFYKIEYCMSVCLPVTTTSSDLNKFYNFKYKFSILTRFNRLLRALNVPRLF